MQGFPFLPGYHLNDPTKNKYHVSRQFRWKNGHAMVKDKSTGIGKAPLDVDAMLFNDRQKKKRIAIVYNPATTYGKAKDLPIPAFQPHYVKYDRKYLSFYGYTLQSELDWSLFKNRVRSVKITYCLADNTVCIVEPAFENAGYIQGCLLKRSLVPNPHHKNKTLLWSDLNNGLEISIFGVTYKLCYCDAFTKNYFLREGVILAPEEPIPDDPYMINRRPKSPLKQSDNPDYICKEIAIEKREQFLQYDGQVLRFYAIWDDYYLNLKVRKYFTILYFLADDQIEIHSPKDILNERNDFTLFLSKTKLPVDWMVLPPDFHAAYTEPDYREYKQYYKPSDIIIGNIVHVMGRKFFVYDCDPFTRKYFEEKLQIIQPEPIEIININIKPNNYKRVIPPHIGVGDPDDSLQNVLSLTPTPPKTLHFVKYVLNVRNKLRYKLKILPVYQYEELRDFLLEYCLGNDQIAVTELDDKNLGFIKGPFVASCRLRKPRTQLEHNIFYGPKDFAIGAKMEIRGRVYVITEPDVWTCNFMAANKEMFTQEAVNGTERFLESKGLRNSH